MDTYMLDGQVLYPVSGAGGSWFETEHRNGAKVEYNGLSNTWTVTKDGYVSTYGLPVGIGSLTMFVGETSEWLLTEVRDPFGNAYTYHYDAPATADSVLASAYGANSGERLLSEVRWADVVVELQYEVRPPEQVNIDFRHGRSIVHERRLSEISVRKAGALYSAYDLVYSDELSGPVPAVPLLEQIRRENPSTGGSKLLREMVWNQSGTDTWTSFLPSGPSYDSQLLLPSVNKAQEHDVLLSSNLDADAFADLVSISYHCDTSLTVPAPFRYAMVATSTCLVAVKAWVNSIDPPAAGFEFGDPVEPMFDSTDPAAVAYQGQLALVLGDNQTLSKGMWAVVDLDGDGQPEIVDGNNQVAWRYRPNSSTPWSSEPLPSLESVPGGGDFQYGWYAVEYSDIDGDGLVDIVQRPMVWGSEPEDVPVDTGEDGYYSIHGIDWEYGEPTKDRDDSYWYRNLGDFQFGPALNLALPLEDPTRYTADFAALDASCGAAEYPVESFGLYADSSGTGGRHEYLELQGSLSDYNGDGIADVAYSFFACTTPVSVGGTVVDEPLEGTFYTEIFWGNGRGDFVASGLAAGQPNTAPEAHPHPTKHGFNPNMWTYRPHNGVMDLSRSGRTELLTATSADTLGFARFRGLRDGFALQPWALGAGYAGDETTLSTLGSPWLHAAPNDFGDGTVSVLGSMTPWQEKSVVGDFDGNGFPDLLHFDPVYDSSGLITSWNVVLQLADRVESEGALLSITNEFGGQTDLVWTSSARIGDNDELHYSREVLASVQLEYDDPTELRYFRGEHAAGRFRGFGLVESTTSGSTRELGYATSPLLEGAPVSVASYRSDGTLESAQINIFGSVLVSGLGLAWDNLPPYANPLLRECSYELGHGTTQADGSRTQTVAMDDLAEMCFNLGSSAQITLEEWLAGMGWYAFPEDGDASSTVADNVWGRTDDELTEIVTTGALDTGSGTPPLVGIPGGPWDDGHVFADEIGTPDSASLPPGTSLATPPTQMGERFPSVGGATELWEWTRDYHYAQDYDGDGIDDMLLETIDDHGLTEGPVSWLLTADDTVQTNVYEPSRDLTNWGFRLRRRTIGNGTTNYQDTIYRYGTAFAGTLFSAPTQVEECGDDPWCGSSILTEYQYSAQGVLLKTTYDDGGTVTRTLDSVCTGQPFTETDQVGRVREYSYDGRCRPQEVWFGGAKTTLTYDGYNRVKSQTIEDATGTLLGHSETEFQGSAVRVYQELDAGYRLTETLVDRLGRPVEIRECGASSTVGETCEGATDAIYTRQTFGTDGRPYAQYGPYADGAGEIPARYSDWGATGRLVATHASEHAVTTTTWRTTEFEYHPGQTLAWGPNGVLTDKRGDPLMSEVYVDGVYRGKTRRDAAGRVVESTSPLGRQVAYRYNELGFLEETWFSLTETVYPSGSSAGTAATYSVQYEYDPVGRVNREIGPDGTSMNWEYDQLGRRVKESFDDGAGGWVDLKEWRYRDWAPFSMVLHGAGSEMDIQDLETGAVRTVLLDALGRIDSQVDDAGTTAYSYGLENHPLTKTDVNGVVQEFTYDVHGRLVTRRNQALPFTSVVQFQYSPGGQVVRTIDPDNVETVTEYTLTGLPTRRFAPGPSGERTLLWEGSYTSTGRAETVFSDGVQVTYAYDGLGRLATEQYGALAEYTRTLSWTDDDEIETETWAPVHTGTGTTEYEYDNWGRLTRLIHPDATEEYFDYDINGQLRFHEDAVGALSEWDYSPRGELTYFKPSTGGAEHFAYSVTAAGERKLEATDAMGGVLAEYKDSLGRVVRQEFQDATAVEYVYLGTRLKEEQIYGSTGGLLAKRTHAYEPATAWLEWTWDWHDPSATGSGVPGSDYLLHYSYTNAGRLAGQGTGTEPVDYVYDYAGLMVEEAWDDQRRESFYDDTWTEAGVNWRSTLLTSTQTINTAVSGVSDLREVEFTYDMAGRLTEKLTTAATTAGTETVTHSWIGLDAYGNPSDVEVERTFPLASTQQGGSSWTYDAMGRPTQRSTDMTIGSTAYPVRSTLWDWYGDGSLEQVQTPENHVFYYDRVLDPSTDEFLLERVDFDSVPVVQNIHRDASLRITQALAQGVTHTFQYDSMGRLDGRSMTGTASGTGSWAGTYNDLGELVQETISDSSGASWTNTYSYSHEGWLETETRGGSGELREYIYDSDGRRTETRVNGVLTRLTTWNGSKVTSVDSSSVTYDDFDGVETDHLLYDYERDATGRVTAVYDGTTGHALVETTRDELGRPVLVEETTGLRETTWGLGLGGLPLEVEGSLGDRVHYLAVEGLLFGAIQTDSTGTTNHVAAMTDAIGTILQVGGEVTEPETAFGEAPGANTLDIRQIFAGLEALPDVPGIQMSQQRMYDEETGRFLSPDPIGLGGGWHRTRYAAGNPTRYSDPSGYSYGDLRYDEGWSVSMWSNDVTFDLPEIVDRWHEPGLVMDFPYVTQWARDPGNARFQRAMAFLDGVLGRREQAGIRDALSSLSLSSPFGDLTTLSRFETLKRGVGRALMWAGERLNPGYALAAQAAAQAAAAAALRGKAVSEPDEVMEVVAERSRSLKDIRAAAGRRLYDAGSRLDQSLEQGGAEVRRKLSEWTGEQEDSAARGNNSAYIGAEVGRRAEETADGLEDLRVSVKDDPSIAGDLVLGATTPGQVWGALQLPGDTLEENLQSQTGVVGDFGLIENSKKNDPYLGLGTAKDVYVVFSDSASPDEKTEAAGNLVDQAEVIVYVAGMVWGARKAGKPDCKCLVGATLVLTASGLTELSSLEEGDVVISVPDPATEPDQSMIPYAELSKLLIYAIGSDGRLSEHEFQTDDLVLLSDGTLRRAGVLEPGDEIFGVQGSLAVQSVQPYSEDLFEPTGVLEVAQ